jgi:hypothetical protein
VIKTLSLVFGIVFLAIGLLGFVPGVTDDNGMLLGIFQVSALHNVIHILSGVAALLAASRSDYARLYFRVFGTVYAIVALVGWVQGTTVLGLIDVNLADNILHTVLAAAILAIGFALPDDAAVAEVRE